jgi:hypothetical protein
MVFDAKIATLGTVCPARPDQISAALVRRHIGDALAILSANLLTRPAHPAAHLAVTDKGDRIEARLSCIDDLATVVGEVMSFNVRDCSHW